MTWKFDKITILLVTQILLGFLSIASGLCQDTKENSEFKLAVNLYNSGMYDLAADQFSNFINAYPGTANSIEARFYLGLTQIKLKRYEEARITFQNFALAYTDNPKAPEAWMRVGDAYASMSNEREAASAYERVKVFHPKSPLAPEALLKGALFYRRAGAKENARKALRTIIQDYPSSSSVPAARFNMGEIYLEEGRIELAQSEFNRVIETAPDPADKARSTLLLGKLYLSTGRTGDAERLFIRIVANYKSTPSFPAAAVELGILLQQSGKYAEAIEQFKKAFADTSAESSVRERSVIELGNSYAALNDFTNALKSYEQFLASFPSDDLVPMIQYKAGQIAARTGNYQAALTYFRKLLSAKEYDLYKRKALVAAAESAVKLKDYAGATSWYVTYLDRYPADFANAEILTRLGNLYEFQLKDIRRAISFYEAVSLKYPRATQVDDALFAIGRCRETLGDVEGALSAYGELIEYYPASEFVPQARERDEFLRHHKAKNRDVGMEKLTALIGEMIPVLSPDKRTGGEGTEQAKARLALKLAEIYFHELKDYRLAAKHFDAAIDAGLNEDQFIDAYFYRARAYHLLTELESDAAAQAITFYDAFLKQFPSGKWSDDAAFYSLQLKSKGKSDVEIASLAKDYLAKRPGSSRRAEVLFMLASSHERLGNLRDAATVLNQLTTESARSPLAEEAWVRLGKLYMQLNVPDSSAFSLNNAVTRFPRGAHTAEGLWLLAGMNMEQHKPVDAIDLYRRIISDHFYSSFAPRAETAIADAYLDAGNFDDAVAQFQTLWDRQQASSFEDQPDYMSLYKLATAFNRKGEKQKSGELYRTYLHYDRNSSTAADAYFALGVIAREQGNTEAASAYFKQAAAISGGGKSTREIADLLFQTEQYPDAAKQYALLIQSTKNESDKEYYQSRIIICKLRTNDLKTAEPLVREFSKTYKNIETYLAEMTYEKGLTYYRTQDYVNATKTFENVAEDYDETRFAAWAEYYLGKILEVTNKSEDAVKKYESILNRFPKSDVIPRISLSLGNINYNAEKYQDAITYYQRIVESPETAGDILPYAMNNLIEAYEAVRLYDGALKVTRDFIDRSPNDPSVMDKRISIGVLYTRLEYYDQAVLHLQHLLDEASSDLEAEIRYDIGEAYYYKGDYQQAILEFLKVPYLVTKQGKVDWIATSFYMAGQSYEKMSKFDQAIAMYQQIIDRPGIDGTFKAAAKKEINRVKMVTKKSSK